jgi:hypothetical protein
MNVFNEIEMPTPSPLIRSGENSIEPSDMSEDGWSDDIEDILKQIRTKCFDMENHHKMKYVLLHGQLVYFRIPLIVIGSTNSIFAVGLTAYIDQSIVSTINCLLSLICAIITSVELFLQIQKRAEMELVSYREFYLLGMKIDNTLDLKREHRPEKDGKMFLSQTIDDFKSLFNSSNVIKKDLVSEHNLNHTP